MSSSRLPILYIYPLPIKPFCATARTRLSTQNIGPVRLRRHMRYEGLILELIWSPYMIWRLLFGRYGDFSIWSSSISAAASNLHAIPYIVVEMELLASYQYGGPNSIFIYQLQVGALLVRAPDRPPHPICLYHHHHHHHHHP